MKPSLPVHQFFRVSIMAEAAIHFQVARIRIFQQFVGNHRVVYTTG